MNAAGKANTIRELYVSVNDSDTYNMQFPSGYCLQHTHATIHSKISLAMTVRSRKHYSQNLWISFPAFNSLNSFASSSSKLIFSFPFPSIVPVTTISSIVMSEELSLKRLSASVSLDGVWDKPGPEAGKDADTPISG